MLGSHLVKKLLSYSSNIIAISRSGGDVHGIKGVACDILDVSSLDEVIQGVDYVFHCAAVVSFDAREKKNLYTINVNGTANVVNAAIDANVKKFIHVSSVASLGIANHVNKLVTEEDAHTGKGSFYGKTKYLGEMEVWRGIGEGLPAVIVNPSIILGEGDWRSGSPQLFKQVYDEFPYFTSGEHGFVDVNDVAEAMILLAKSSVIEQRFILNGINISFKDLFSLMALSFDKKPPHRKVGKWLSEIIWRVSYLYAILKGSKPLLTKETARSAQSIIHYDNSKLLTAFPDFSYTPIQVTIDRIVQELKSRYNL